MKREEKNLLSRKKIINSAIAEFGTNSYAEASINSICKNGDISKGSIYHYFKDKDDLYLFCVTECFNRLTKFLNSKKTTFNDIEDYITKFIDMRHEFFSENPYFSYIFASAVLQPPKHLIRQIKNIKMELDILNVNYYESAIENVNLKKDVNYKDAIEYFIMFQESFNDYYQNRIYEDYQKLVDDHELRLSKMLKMMLYGIVKEEIEE